MSKSWRAAPDAPLLRKPQYERTLKEEMAEMDSEIYQVWSEWKPNDCSYELNELVSEHRSEHGAWRSLHAIAEGQNVELKAGETSFEIQGDAHTEYYTWYIDTGILGD